MATRLTIRGVVQGVGYRQWLCQEAGRLGLAGWVRNRRDGSVEAVIDGPPEAMASLIERARSGPPAARVSSVEAADFGATVNSGFEWRPTA